MVGGITPDAHHPPRPEMGDQNIIISDKTAGRVHRVKTWFADGSAIYHVSADPGALVAGPTGAQTASTRPA